MRAECDWSTKSDVRRGRETVVGRLRRDFSERPPTARMPERRSTRPLLIPAIAGFLGNERVAPGVGARPGMARSNPAMTKEGRDHPPGGRPGSS